MRIRAALATTAAFALVATMTACSGGGGKTAGSKEITVAFWQSGSNSSKALEKVFTDAKTEFEKENPGVTVKINPIKAGEGDYATKLGLMAKNPSTAPDVMYEDTYRLGADAAAGNLGAIDDHVKGWDEWAQYPKAIQQGVTGGDGKIYGIPIDTDTRGLWYNKDVLQKAGVKVPWEPKNWDEVLDAARKIKTSQPDVLPFNIYAGKVKAEASSMQGFEMLLYGTENTLYKDGKWVVGSQGFKDALGFEDTLFKEKLGPTPQNLGNTAWDQVVNTELFPAAKVGISLDGSWVPGSWAKDSNKPWAEWADHVGWTAMPTQKGQAPGAVSMSGGWALSMSAHSKNPEMAFKYMTKAMSFQHSLDYSIANASVAVRDDVAKDKKFTDSSPSIGFFASLVKSTHFRPGDENYEKVSAEIQLATEKILNGQGTPEEIAKAYDEAVTKIVGDAKVTTG